MKPTAGSVNKVILVGNLGKNPEVRNVQNGNKIVSFTLATNEGWTDKASGERREKTERHRIVIFNERLVEVAGRFLRKVARSTLRACCRYASGPTNRARSDSPPRSCSTGSAAS